MVVAISLVIGAVGGYFYGKNAASDEARKQWQAILDLAYPPPPNEVTTITGKIVSLEDYVFDLEADDPADYLPHPDGSPRKKIKIRVNSPASVEYLFVDYSKFDNNGNPAETKLDYSGLRVGDLVTVQADADVLKTKSANAVRVTVLKY